MTSIRTVKPDMVFFTSSPIINETISLLQSRGYASAAWTFPERVRPNEEVQIVHPDPALQAETWDLFGRWGGAGANAIDCVSFTMMPRPEIRQEFSFDAHFQAAGFDTLGAHSQPREARS